MKKLLFAYLGALFLRVFFFAGVLLLGLYVFLRFLGPLPLFFALTLAMIFVFWPHLTKRRP